MPDAPLKIKFNTPFQQAVEAANQRGVMLPADYYALPAAMRSRAFTVSYLAKLDQVQAIFTSLQKAQVSGISLQQWQKEIDYKQFGVTKAHAETVFRNAMQTHYAIGHWESFQRTKKALPYLRYSAINDSRTSVCCRALSGIIRRVDDPFWTTHTPPNHHNCRSTLQALTESQAQKRSPAGVGLNQVESDLMNPQTGWDYNPAASHDAMLKGLVKEKIAKLPQASNWFKKTLSEQVAKKMAELSPMVESSVFEKQMIDKVAMLEALDYEKALTQVKQGLEGTAFAEFYHGEFKGNYPVGVLSKSDQALLNAKTKTVLLSRESLDDHKEKHPEIGLEDYRKITEIVKNGEIYNSKKKRFVLLHIDGYTYRAAMKVTLDGMENFFLSLIKLQDEKADKEIRKKFERIR